MVSRRPLYSVSFLYPAASRRFSGGIPPSTLIVTSHILPELADICNKIGIIERGELIVNEQVDEVMRRVRKQTILNVAVADDREIGQRHGDPVGIGQLAHAIRRNVDRQ